MGYYLLKRLMMTVLVIFVAMLFLGSLSHIVPGDPVKLMLGPRAKPEMIERVRVEMELDKPVVVQVLHFAWNALRGDLGKDFITRAPVTRLIGSVLPHTIYLAVFSLLLASLVGIPLGVFSAFRPNSWIDRVTSIFSVSLITMPTFVAALLLLLLFAVQLRVLPAIGVGDPSDPWDYFKHLILPGVAMAVTWIGYLARLVRASTLEILNANYIRTAYAYGLSERLISYKYALKNSLIPTVAVLGVGLGNLLGGAIFVEVIFARPGLGYLVYQAEMTRNYPIVRGGTLIVALLFVFANLLADLSYHYLDPRIQIAKLELMTAAITSLEEKPALEKSDRPSFAHELFRRPAGVFGLVIILFLIVLLIFGPLIAPYSAISQDIKHRLEPPSTAHLLGTDHLGRDLLSRLIIGARVALGVAFPAVLFALVAGSILGMLAGYLGGWVDNILIVVTDSMQAFPSMMLALALLSLLEPSVQNVILVIAISYTPGYARIVRAQVLAIREAQYIEVERAFGATDLRIALVHILPNILAPLFILLAMDLPTAITTEAGLSFLGLGVRPPTPSWGVILNEGFQGLRSSYWPVLDASLVLMLATLGFTLFGETLRDILDPRLTGSRRV